MAIEEPPDLKCGPWWRHKDNEAPPAVGFTPDESMGADGQWWPVCQSCIDELEADPVEHDVVYLDPTRQRRPSTYVRQQSNDDRPGTTGPYLPAQHHDRAP